MDRPRLRALEAFPVELDGHRRIALRDPLGVAGDTLLLTEGAFAIALLFDGKRSLFDVQTECCRRTGEIVPRALLERIASALDENLLLENERFRKAREEVFAGFAAAEVREPAHAGRGYPAGAPGARARLEEILGKAPDARPVRDARGVLAPHIDFFRGEVTYAKTYGALRGNDAPDLALVLGTAHAPTEGIAALTRKDYATPLGPARTAREVVEAIAERVGGDLFRDEFAHRGEHSVEFQALWLRYLFPETPIVPVLCGALQTRVPKGAAPSSVAEVEVLVRALVESVRGARRLLVVAGADLAHVGPRFGTRPLTPAYLREVEREDLATLDRVAALDADGFYLSVVEGGDPRNVCGLAPIYLALRALAALGASGGALVEYRPCVSEDQCVTIAGMTFT